VATFFAPEQDDAEVSSAILEQVDRFVRRSVDPRARRPEAPMPASDLDALLDEARSMGLVNQEAADGLGVWSDGGDPANAVLSARILRRIARSNAGVALALHREALANAILRRLGIAIAGHGTAAVQGRHGLGRRSLARHLAGEPLDADDRAMLADWAGTEGDRIATVPESFDWIVAPVADNCGVVGWGAWPRDRLTCHRLPHAHGFDELTTVAFRPSPSGDGARAGSGAEGVGAACLAAAQCTEALGLMSIGLGAADRAHAMARSYASSRSQGGRPIERHAAVQLLLASSRRALVTVEALVESSAVRRIGAPGLAAIFAARAEAHPLLCRAANDDLQVFGGSGYMRDTGAEKIVRDLNHLRVISGSPPELSLFVAEWERIHGL
jgi:acyl-CoA dehydrogenase